MNPVGSRPRHLGAHQYRLAAVSGRTMTDPAVAMSAILGLLASGKAVTRPALARETALSPATVDTHLETLQRHQLVVPGAPAARVGRGRPAGTYLIGGAVGVVAAVSITVSHLEVAIMTLNQRCLAYEYHSIVIADGPRAVLGMLEGRLREMLAALSGTRLLVISIGLPGPVDSHQGTPVRPPIMPGWDDHPVAARLSEEFECMTIVDNDANLMALGESRALPPEELPLLYMKVGTGIGGGLVTADGQLHRGAHGAAGDIGHIRVMSDSHQICSCGNTDCLEAVASVAAMARALGAETGNPEFSQEDLIAAVRVGDPAATRTVRLGAAILGEAAATLVHLYNPARISLGGPLIGASDDLLAGVRSVVYQRALPLATRNLNLAHSVLGREAAIVGASVAAIDAVLSVGFISDHLL